MEPGDLFSYDGEGKIWFFDVNGINYSHYFEKNEICFLIGPSVIQGASLVLHKGQLKIMAYSPYQLSSHFSKIS